MSEIRLALIAQSLAMQVRSPFLVVMIFYNLKPIVQNLSAQLILDQIVRNKVFASL